MRCAIAGRRAHNGPAGIAAVEFALIAPLMTTCLFGTIEMTNVIRVQAKVNIAAGQIAQMVAAQPAVILGTASGTNTGEYLSDICAGAALNMLPYSITALQASIGSVTVDATLGFEHPDTNWTTDTPCGATSYHAGQSLLYSYANTPRSLFTTDGTPYGAGGTPVNGYTAISVQVRYTYQNVLPLFLGRSIILTGFAAARPRGNSTITCTVTSSGNQTACPQNP